MGRLSGKVAFITGGARGQGKAIALRFAEEGANLILGDACHQGVAPYPLSSEADLQETAALIRARGAGCVAEIADVRSQAALDGLVARGVAEFGGVDIACANAGIFFHANFWEMTDQEWDDVIAVNLTGVWHTAKAVAPHMVARQSGSIIFTASTNARTSMRDYCAYTASKHGVIGVMKSVAMDLGPYGVRANALLPGAMDTPMMNNPYTKQYVTGSPEATHQELADMARHGFLLRGRSLLPPRAMADAALWLASDESEHVTGAEISVDAGTVTLPHHNTSPTP
jgi:SDR family mycofactocin-dependent oxidoreductase